MILLLPLIRYFEAEQNYFYQAKILSNFLPFFSFFFLVISLAFLFGTFHVKPASYVAELKFHLKITFNDTQTAIMLEL